MRILRYESAFVLSVDLGGGASHRPRTGDHRRRRRHLSSTASRFIGASCVTLTALQHGVDDGFNGSVLDHFRVGVVGTFSSSSGNECFSLPEFWFRHRRIAVCHAVHPTVKSTEWRQQYSLLGQRKLWSSPVCESACNHLLFGPRLVTLADGAQSTI